MSPIDPIQQLYKKVVLDHKRNPRHCGPVPGANLRAEAFNPVCGDHLILEARESGGLLEEVGVVARGCAISIAAGSILTEVVAGMEIAALDPVRTAAERIVGGGEIPPGDFGDLAGLEGVRAFPSRRRCALLVWEALDHAVGGIPGRAPGEGPAPGAGAEEASR